MSGGVPGFTRMQLEYVVSGMMSSPKVFQSIGFKPKMRSPMGKELLYSGSD